MTTKAQAKNNVTKLHGTEPDNTADTVTANGDETKGKININTCSAEHLATLPQMTGSRAASIINHRNQFGAFPTMRRVRDVPGISDTLLTALMPHCYTGDVDAPSEREKEIDSNL